MLAKQVETGEASRLSTLFLPLIDAAHLAKGLISSLSRRHTGSDMVVNEVLEVVLELLVQLLFYFAAPEQRSETHAYLAAPSHGP